MTDDDLDNQALRYGITLLLFEVEVGHKIG